MPRSLWRGAISFGLIHVPVELHTASKDGAFNEILPPAAATAKSTSKSERLAPAELSMAKKLVEEMCGPWKPGAFKDTYRADLMRRIQEKIRRKQVHSLAAEAEQSPARPKAQVIDLMEALKNSLERRAPTSNPAAPRKSVAKSRRRA
jgi:non-homologous end joining protein Ku